MKAERTLILIMDDAQARFLVNDGPGTGLRALSSLSLDQFADTLTGYDDRPGRQSGGPGGAARHGFDPEETLEDLNRARFASHVVTALDGEWAKAKADRLIVAAAPKMLGVLRKELRGAPAKALAADLAKDLMKIPPHDLPSHFEGLIRL
jgi:protein required for attachment to host cells